MNRVEGPRDRDGHSRRRSDRNCLRAAERCLIQGKMQPVKSQTGPEAIPGPSSVDSSETKRDAE